ncbi:hypothetical protein BKA70DRAFT_1217027 [Coprinopsis sp. MPI-PUGE-AT-0042]|nr:hypothetical protein BKA70DRAFT_1217027 [Coprinopsis sp. MPI-PUGE-AT-0042]
MTSYYPSQAGYSTTQPVMYGQPSYQGTAYAPSAGVMYVSPSDYSPTSYAGDGRHDHHRHHHHGARRHRPKSRSYPRSRSKSRSGYHSHRHSSVYERPATPYYNVLEQSPYLSSYYRGAPMVQAAPVMMQPSAGYQQGFDPRQLTFGQRMRLFFGLAPTPAFKYRSDKNWWGFMGYSRRQRFIDPRTGGEVDRHGRPVIRV